MGLLRSSLVIIVSVILFILLMLNNSFLILGLSLQYEHVKPELISVFEKFVDENNIMDKLDEGRALIEDYCADNHSEFVFKDEASEQTITIYCDSINSSSDILINESVGALVDSFYYKEYNCEFWNCLEEEKEPFFLISEKAKNYWEEKFYLALFLSIALLLLLFFIIKDKTTFFIVAGGLLIFSSLIFLRIEWLFSFLGNILSDFFRIFFSQSSGVSLVVIIIGISLVVLGILLKIFKIGIKISEFFEKLKNRKKTSS